MDVNALMAFGFPALLIVIGLVEFCKKLGANGNVSLVLSVAFGVLLMVVVQVTAQFPAIEPWVKAVVTGLVVGLSATGLYDLARKFRP